MSSPVIQVPPLPRRRFTRWLAAPSLIAVGLGMGVTVNAVLFPPLHLGWALLAATILVSCIPVAAKTPVTALCIYLPVFTIVGSVPSTWMAMSTLTSPFLLGQVAYHGRRRLNTITFLALWIAGSINFSASPPKFQELDAFIVWGLMLGVSLAVGNTIGRAIRRHRRILRDWENDIRQRRQTIATDLHDSVAASLTSIVMRAEVLGLESADNPRLAEELEEVATLGRHAMSQTRALLKVLMSEDEHSPVNEESAPSLRETLRVLEHQIESSNHSLEIIGHDTLMRLDFSPAELIVISRVLREAGLNAQKYSPRESTFQLLCDYAWGRATLTLTNPIALEEELADVRDRLHMSSGLGLPSLGRLAESVNASLNYGTTDGIWSLTLRLPVMQRATPPAASET